MAIMLYSLSFIPLLLITLTVHELGHLIAARMNGIAVSAFQIGIGWKIAAFHTGRTEVRLGPGTLMHTPGGTRPRPGQQVAAYVSRDAEGRYQATAVVGLEKDRYTVPVDTEELREHARNHMLITGRVRDCGEDRMRVAAMCWSLRAIPLMAAVYLPEDPSGRTEGVYNTAGWRKQTIITLAGPLANLALLAVAIMALALVPATGVRAPIMTVDRVEPGSPAELAGIRPGDHIIQVGNVLVPDREELKLAIFKAMLSGRPLHLHLKRGSRMLTLPVNPDQQTGRIGVTLAVYVSPAQRHQMGPGAVGSRAVDLGMAYFRSARLMVDQIGQEGTMPTVSGPIAAAYYTAQAIEYARFRAWLAILAALTLGTAALNLLPLPPLDGYRLVTQTVQGLRGGKAINPRVERVMIFGGLALIVVTGLYLAFHDIMHLLE